MWGLFRSKEEKEKRIELDEAKIAANRLADEVKFQLHKDSVNKLMNDLNVKVKCVLCLDAQFKVYLASGFGYDKEEDSIVFTVEYADHKRKGWHATKTIVERPKIKSFDYIEKELRVYAKKVNSDHMRWLQMHSELKDFGITFITKEDYGY